MGLHHNPLKSDYLDRYLDIFQLSSIIMSRNGTFKRTGQTGMVEALMDSGFPEDMVKKAADMSNVVTITTSCENGMFNIQVENSKAPMFNISSKAKIGEAVKETNNGVTSTITCKEKGADTIEISRETDAGKFTNVIVYTDSGLTMSAEGVKGKFNQVFERQ